MEKKSQKHFFWIKLWEWFMHSDQMKLILRQRNGPLYIVLFLYLCIDTANYNGFFEKKIGDYSIDLDAREIYSQYLPYFQNCEGYSFDSVQLALEIYKQLGLTCYENGKLKITEHDKLVGSESNSAERVRRLRARNKALNEKNKELEEALHCNETALQCNTDVTPIRELDSNIIRYLRNYNIDVSSITDNNEPSEIQRFNFKGNVLLSQNQINDLLEKLSLDEFDFYLGKMSEMISKGYSFSKSAYEKILEMADQDRRIKNG